MRAESEPSIVCVMVTLKRFGFDNLFQMPRNLAPAASGVTVGAAGVGDPNLPANVGVTDTSARASLGGVCAVATRALKTRMPQKYCQVFFILNHSVIGVVSSKRLRSSAGRPHGIRARITAFKPGQSPPLVTMPIFIQYTVFTKVAPATMPLSSNTFAWENFGSSLVIATCPTVLTSYPRFFPVSGSLIASP